MQPRILIFCSILFIINASHAMEIKLFTHSLHSMEVFKKKKHPVQEKEQIIYNHPIITDFLIIQKMSSVNNIPKELTLIIQQYCMQIRDQNFKDSFLSLNVWNDFQIPLHYHYCLTPEQILCLQKYFTYRHSNIPYPREQRLAMHYTLTTEDDYKTFITIPIEIRRYLTKLPQSAYKENKFNFTNTDINEYKIVCVVTRSNDLKGKYIIPEEGTKKIKLDVNR